MADTYEDQIEVFIQSCNAIRHRLAEAKARCKRSGHAEKRERAIYKKAAKLRGFKTDAAQQREWEASESYMKWFDNDIAVFLEKDKLQADVDSGEMEWETWRTRRADRRAEINLR